MVNSVLLLVTVLVYEAAGFAAPPHAKRKGENLFLHSEEQPRRETSFCVADDHGRRFALATFGLTSLTILSSTRPAWGANFKSRTQGYGVQAGEEEWKSMLSPLQYQILREGGTERPGFSILEKEKRPGLFNCAGCGTPLFASKDKFNSGTGWPSFARGLAAVETEQVNIVAATLGGGAELRCGTCGGHLGDVFQDGFLFPGTPAMLTGKRYCIDGAALVFVPDNKSEAPLQGDRPAPAKPLPSFLEPPKITPQI